MDMMSASFWLLIPIGTIMVICAPAVSIASAVLFGFAIAGVLKLIWTVLAICEHCLWTLHTMKSCRTSYLAEERLRKEWNRIARAQKEWRFHVLMSIKKSESGRRPQVDNRRDVHGACKGSSTRTSYHFAC
jgi:hypothetical protein